MNPRPVEGAVSSAVPSGPVGESLVLYPQPIEGMEFGGDCYELFVSPVLFFFRFVGCVAVHV